MDAFATDPMIVWGVPVAVGAACTATLVFIGVYMAKTKRSRWWRLAQMEISREEEAKARRAEAAAAERYLAATSRSVRTSDRAVGT